MSLKVDEPRRPNPLIPTQRVISTVMHAPREHLGGRTRPVLTQPSTSRIRIGWRNSNDGCGGIGQISTNCCIFIGITIRVWTLMVGLMVARWRSVARVAQW